MTDEQIIELMARAICDDVHKGGDWGVTGAEAWENRRGRLIYTYRAIAALTALRSAGMAVVPREPTSEQIVAGQGVFLDNGYAHGELHDGTLRKAYRAMINTAEGKTE